MFLELHIDQKMSHSPGHWTPVFKFLPVFIPVILFYTSVVYLYGLHSSWICIFIFCWLFDVIVPGFGKPIFL